MHYTLCDMFSDLTANAVEAGANVISVGLAQTDREISISIDDDGTGMSPETLARATDPFYTDGIKHPKRRIGLGLPFLIQTAETTGGWWAIWSKKDGVLGYAGGAREAPQRAVGDANGHGTRIEARFDLTNIDTPPIGDVAGYFRQVLTFDRPYEMVIERTAPTHSWTARRSELLDALGLTAEAGFTDASSIVLLGQYLESAEQPA